MQGSLNRTTRLWFRISVVAGVLVAVISVGVAVATYRFVTGHLAVDHLNREAGRYAAVLEYRAKDQAGTPAELADLLDSLLQEDSSQIAWFRVLGRGGDVVAEAGEVQQSVFAEEDYQQVLEMRRRNVVKRLSTADGEILAAVLPFRFQLGSEMDGRSGNQGSGPSGRFKLIEVGLFVSGASEAFTPLKRNLIAGILAPLALLLSMIFLLLQFPGYLRGRELESQLAVAHRVQQALLPPENPDSGDLEVTAEFRPFWGVGGDYFDVFTLGKNRTFIVLGDVSGKGLPAALIMGLLHGAVRATAQAWDGSNHHVLAGELNQLLYANTASNRFVTFFWACFESQECRLRLVNAGHNPPLIVRRPRGAAPAIEQIPAGGPVLGLLPEASYRSGDTILDPGDVLVLFSDGVVEATNSEGIEFGEKRIEDVIREHADLAPEELKREILGQLAAFMGSATLHDDLTLLIVKVPEGHVVHRPSEPV